MIRDPFGRKIDYVRVAVTDRCNLRCYYCMPGEGIVYEDSRDLLTCEEIYFLLMVLGDIGFSKVRFTGGEPFMRQGFMSLLRKSQELGIYDSLHITSNGVLIKKHLQELRALGVLDINLSLDSLDEERFRKITRRNHFQKVMDSFEAMLSLGFRVKINAVVMRGMNEQDILPLSLLTRNHPVDVRFIEEMPFNGSGKFNPKIFRAGEIRSLLEEAYPGMRALSAEPGATTVQFQIPGHRGRVGIIAAFTRTFCDTCNRLRITAKGEIKNCLYDSGIFSVRDYLRQGASRQELADKIRELIRLKPRDGFEAERQRPRSRIEEGAESMSMIGG